MIDQIALSPPLVPAAVEWLNRLPRFNASNNWAVAGRQTRSGFPILCGDPHLEVNRLPNVWQEVILRRPPTTMMGVSIPGVPGLIFGRSNHLAWSATYAYMDMLDLYRQVEAVSMNWVFADVRGNIGYQMSGRHFKRPEGISGLLPHAGWDEQFDPGGFNDPGDLPNVLNPPEGIIATANQDLNYLGRSNPINLAMGPYRADRIVQLLETGSALDVAYMEDMHYDLYSLQAESLMEIIGPLLPDTDNGRILKAWNLRYDADPT